MVEGIGYGTERNGLFVSAGIGMEVVVRKGDGGLGVGKVGGRGKGIGMEGVKGGRGNVEKYGSDMCWYV